MLSILIPVYENDITPLVKELHQQCARHLDFFEIVCFDDFSSEKIKDKNKIIGTMSNVSYIELWENHGRAKIRNLLAQNARFEKLLFIDSDSKVKSKKFIKNYIDSLSGNMQCICGGRQYNKQKPKNSKKVLHWTYGSKRETKDLKTRGMHSYSLFHSNNFLIDRELFLNTKFDESIDGYGYEDLVFGHDLQKKGISIKHINNPVLHAKLDNLTAYLEKSAKASQNLALLYHTKRIMDTKLIKTYLALEKWGLTGLYSHWYAKNRIGILEKLSREEVSLFRFNLYKLGEFIKEYKTLTKI